MVFVVLIPCLKQHICVTDAYHNAYPLLSSLIYLSQASPSASLQLRKKPSTPQSEGITPNKPNRSQWPGCSRF